MNKIKNKKLPSGPVEVNNLIIKVDRSLCIGAATCIAFGSKAFALDKEGKAVILESADQETEKALLEAAESCPVLAISIKRKK